jgi:kynurenine formamidase
MALRVGGGAWDAEPHNRSNGAGLGCSTTAHLFGTGPFDTPLFSAKVITMPRRFIDLSVAIENDVPADPPGYELSIEYLDHKATLPILFERYENLKAEHLPNGEAFALERVSLSTHNGTHVDAPWHYASTTVNDERMQTIDELPLDWFFRPGVKLDFRKFPDGYVVRSADIEVELERIGYQLQPFDIVLINTSAGEHYGKADYTQRGCGMGREATLFLTSQGIRVAGTDAWSWDVPYKFMAERFAATRDGSIIWEGHKAGRERPYSHIEKLHNLQILPPFGFTVACFPVKVCGASGGWTRAVAMIDDD